MSKGIIGWDNLCEDIVSTMSKAIERGKMLKSCQYCGKVHDATYICKQKAEAIKRRQSKKSDHNIEQFRGSPAWKEKRAEIRERDSQVCQVCIRGLYKPIRKYETDELQVHHIKPMATCWDSRLDNDILITLCSRHHEMAEAGEIPAEELLKIAQEQERTAPGGCTW